MQFTHRDQSGVGAAERVATVQESESPTSVLVQHIDAAGKARKKTFKTASKFLARNQVTGKALDFLFGQGFVLRSPQEGPIQWLTRTEEAYPHGFVAAWAGGQVWVGDTGFLRRVTPGTCEQLDLPLGDLVMPRAISASDSHVYALLDTQSGGVSGAPPFVAPSQGDLAYRVVRVEGESVVTEFDVPYDPSAAIAGSLSAARDGRILGPHADGVAIYVDGHVEESWSAAPTKHRGPDAAMSPDGESIVITAPDGALRFEGREPRLIPAGFEQVLGLGVDDSGTAWVSGLGDQFWGLYRVAGFDVTKASNDPYATFVPEREAVVEVESGKVRLRPLGGADPEVELDLPWLGMAKKGQWIQRSGSEGIVLTDANTLAGVALPS